MKVTLRPLVESDALISWAWRNDPSLWIYTGSSPERSITHEDELNWIRAVLLRKNESRFAICVGDVEQYVGNVKLTNITLLDSEFHIFIGDKSMHGLGVGYMATTLLLKHAKSIMRLAEVYLYVHKKNLPAIKIYEKCGFIFSGYEVDNRLKYTINLSNEWG